MEQGKIPAAGEFYRHFKGNLYQIVGIARHAETEERMVVYQALYGDYCLYVRPLKEFLGLVDRTKYPDAAQTYRFERTAPEENSPACGRQTAPEREQGEADEDTKEDTECVREEILRFLDAKGADAKLKVLKEIRMVLDEDLITTIELSLDLLPDDRESMERRFDLIERTLEQRIRFESGRLRF